MSELYRIQDCVLMRLDTGVEDCSPECPASREGQPTSDGRCFLRDEQAERDRDLGRAVREAVRATCASGMVESEIAVDIRSYARLLDGMPNPAIWAALILRAIAAALEQEAANAATGH